MFRIEQSNAHQSRGDPTFTYLWALREIARAFLGCAGMTFRGELARVTGLSRPDAGLGNGTLVAEGAASR